MILDIDSKNNHEYVIEDLDEEHVLVKETKVAGLKALLNQAGSMHHDTDERLTFRR